LFLISKVKVFKMCVDSKLKGFEGLFDNINKKIKILEMNSLQTVNQEVIVNLTSKQTLLTDKVTKMESKVDHIIKTISKQSENTENNLKSYVSDIVQNSEKGFKNQIEMFELDVKSAKLENGKYHIEAMKKIKELKEDHTSFIEFRSQFISELNQEMTIIKEGRKSIQELKNEVKKTSSSLLEVKEYLNVFLTELLI